MIETVRAGGSKRSVARRFWVGVPTVLRWVERAEGLQLDEVEWSDRPSIPHKTRRTDDAIEDRVVSLRHQLRHHNDLGEFGAVAIEREWLRQGWTRP